MQDNTKPPPDQALATLCSLLQATPVQYRPEIVSAFNDEFGPVPADWSTIVDKIVRGEGSSAPGFKIKELWAYVSEEPDGTEGIVGFGTPGGGMMPMIGADKDRIVSLRQKARVVAQESGYRIKLVKFSVREDVQDIEP